MYKKSVSINLKMLLCIISLLLLFSTISLLQTSCSLNKKNIHDVTQVKHTIADILNTQPSLVKMTPILEGLSGAHIFKINTLEKEYVARFIDQKPINERIHEININKIASEEGFGPKIYHTDTTLGLILMDSLKNESLTQSRSSNNLYQSLGKVVQKMHSAQYPELKELPTIFDRLNKFLDTINFESAPQHKEKLSMIIKEIQNALKTFTHLSFVHGDLHPSNILLSDNKIYIIDYERSAFGDPYFDLATIGNYYLFTEDSTNLFLTSYLDHPPTRQEKAKFYLMKQISYIYFGLNLLNKMQDKEIKQPSFVPPLFDLFAKLSSKEMTLKSIEEKNQFSFSLLQEAINNYHSSNFSKEITLLQH